MVRRSGRLEETRPRRRSRTGMFSKKNPHDSVKKPELRRTEAEKSMEEEKEEEEENEMVKGVCKSGEEFKRRELNSSRS